MGAPDPMDQDLQDHFADPNEDDPNPGNVRDARLSLLAAKFAPANVAVALDLDEYDVREDFAFRLNSDTPRIKQPLGKEYEGADSVRDVKNNIRFWVVQVIGAYEFNVAQDIDPNSEAGATLGINSFSASGAGEPVVFIFLETIRDYSANGPPITIAPGDNRFPLASADLEEHTVVHEVGHTFLGPHWGGTQNWSNQGIMNADVTMYGTDSEFRFTVRQLGEIQNQTKPHTNSG
jgi:hypothetical protein